jgi:hypothetical protein
MRHDPIARCGRGLPLLRARDLNERDGIGRRGQGGDDGGNVGDNGEIAQVMGRRVRRRVSSFGVWRRTAAIMSALRRVSSRNIG